LKKSIKINNTKTIKYAFIFKNNLYPEGVLKIPEKDIDITKANIKSYTINLLRNTISISTTNLKNKVLIKKSKEVIEWLDSLYFLKQKISFVIGIFSFLLLTFINYNFWYLGFFFGLLNIITAQLYYNILNENIKNAFYKLSAFIVIFIFIISFIVPPILQVLIIYLIYASIMVFLYFLIKKEKTIFKIYAHTSWMFLIIVNYFFLACLFKISIDYQAHTLKENISLKYENNIVESKNDKWEKPQLWDINQFNFFLKYLHSRNLSFQIQPFKIQYGLKFAGKEIYSGWVGAVNSESKEVLLKVKEYITAQKLLFWYPLWQIEPWVEKKIKLFSKEGVSFENKSYIQKYNFIDAVDFKVRTIYVVCVPFLYNKDNSWLWVIEIPFNITPDYYLHKLSAGLIYNEE